MARCLGAAVLALAAQACVVHDTRPVNAGYGYGAQTRVAVGEPSPFNVASLPPEPLYEQMTASPGFGHVWIDGYWHWNHYEWVWVGGRWERQQVGQVYVQPHYDMSGGTYVYTPGYWTARERIPRGWAVRDHRDGRPSVVRPPAGYRPPPTSTARTYDPPRSHQPPAPQPPRPTGHTYQPTPTARPYTPPAPSPTARPYTPPAPAPTARPPRTAPGATYQPPRPTAPSRPYQPPATSPGRPRR